MKRLPLLAIYHTGDCDYEFSDLEIKEYLSKKFFSDIQKNATRQKLAKRLDDFNYVKARMVEHC